MSRQLHTLTDIQLKQWIRLNQQDKQPIAKADGHGLTFTLSKAGTASWILRYRAGGKRHELTLGNYPDVSLSEARRLASVNRAAVDQGQHPAKEKAARKNAAAEVKWTVEALAHDYEAKRLTPGSFAEGTLYYRKSDLKRVIIPKLGKMSVEEVTGKDVVRMLRESNETWTISKRVRDTTNNLFKHAAGLHLIEVNPCAGVDLKALFGPRPPVKKRVMLSKADLTTLLATADTLNKINGLTLRILLATCVRSRELTSAEWKDIDLEAGSWFVPDQKTKTRKGFFVPLTPPVVGWFRELKTLAGESQFVLPARIARKEGQPITVRTLWAAIDRAFEDGRLTISRFTPHDCRSTAKSHLRDLGISELDTERALNHVIGGISGVYDVRETLREKQHALTAWSDFLLSLTPSQHATASNPS
jgi:integrase